MSEGKIFSAEAVFGLEGWCEFDAVKATDYKELERELAEAKELITSYQIRVDNDALRLNVDEAALVYEYGGDYAPLPVMQAY